MSCCCLNLCCLLPLQREWISTKSSPNNVLLSSDFYSFTNNWMKGISDDTFISQLNIPGTHNSMAVRRYFGITIGICQKWTLLDQLNSGIRFLDIRIKEDIKGLFPLHHEMIFQKTHLDEDVIKVCEDFLQSNPTETIIIFIRIEVKEKSADPFGIALEKMILNKRTNEELQKYFSFATTIPRIQDIRGKIWIWPNNWHHQGLFNLRSNIQSGCLKRQDLFEATVKDKKVAVRNANDAARDARQQRILGQQIFMNQLNGVNWHTWPMAYANEINKFIFQQELLEGIVLLDFPGEGLIKKIIESNFPRKKEEGKEEIYREESKE